MSEHEVALIDIEDVQVRGLAGRTKRKWRPKRVELEMTTEISIDEDDNRAKVDIELEMFGRDNTDDEAERVLTYTGSVSLAVIPAKGFKFIEGTEQAKSLIEVVWPIARTSLIEHAQRLGTHSLRIPLVMVGDVQDQLQEKEAEEVAVATSAS